MSRVLEAFTSTGDVAWWGQVTGPSETEAYVVRLLNPDASHLPFAMVGEGDLLSGLVALSADSRNRNAWFWYWTHSVTRGRGWTGCTVTTVTSWAPTSGGLHRLEFDHRLNNPASRGMALAAGFAQEGLRREKSLVNRQRIDVVIYGRLASDPTPRIESLPITTVPNSEWTQHRLRFPELSAGVGQPGITCWICVDAPGRRSAQYSPGRPGCPGSRPRHLSTLETPLPRMVYAILRSLEEE